MQTSLECQRTGEGCWNRGAIDRFVVNVNHEQAIARSIDPRVGIVSGSIACQGCVFQTDGTPKCTAQLSPGYIHINDSQENFSGPGALVMEDILGFRRTKEADTDNRAAGSAAPLSRPADLHEQSPHHTQQTLRQRVASKLRTKFQALYNSDPL